MRSLYPLPLSSSAACTSVLTSLPVSYTHLDVYKRQLSGHTKSLGENSSRLMLLYKYRDWSFYASCIFPFTPRGAEYRSESLSPVIPSTSHVYILDNRNMVTVGVSWRLNFGKQLQLIDRTLQNRDSNESVVK